VLWWRWDIFPHMLLLALASACLNKPHPPTQLPPPMPSAEPAAAPPAEAVRSDRVGNIAPYTEPSATAEQFPSGLYYQILVHGRGSQHPDANDRVTVHYNGWTPDGTLVDSSVNRGTPATFGLNQVIPGWTEGLQLMVVGETARFWIPESLGYKGQPGRPGGLTVWDVELLALDAVE
jgi:FKBP-type peptidyl-prolyl cis-trans isomerase